MAAETYSLVKDWLAAEEREAIMMKGFAKPIRTYAVKGIHDEFAGEGRLIHREKAGLSLTINCGQLNPTTKAEVIGELKSVLSELED